jgi:hypothetical protein
LPVEPEMVLIFTMTTVYYFKQQLSTPF